MRIRLYQDRDFEAVWKWLDKDQKKEWTKETIPIQSTWVMENEKGKPVFVGSLLLTNFKAYCFAMNFIGDPKFKGPMRGSYRERFVSFLESMARQLGYKKIAVLTRKKSLSRLYAKWGYGATVAMDFLNKEI